MLVLRPTRRHPLRERCPQDGVHGLPKMLTDEVWLSMRLREEGTLGSPESEAVQEVGSGDRPYWELQDGPESRRLNITTQLDQDASECSWHLLVPTGKFGFNDPAALVTLSKIFSTSG